MIDPTTVSMIRDIVAIFGVIAGFTYYVLTVQNTRKNQQLQLETRQAQLYMNIYRDHVSKENQADLNTILRWETESYDAFNEKYSSQEWSLLLSYFANLDGIGTLVSKGLMDTELVYELQYVSIITIWEKFLPITVESRKRWSAPQLWVKSEYLYDEMVKIRDERGHVGTDVLVAVSDIPS